MTRRPQGVVVRGRAACQRLPKPARSPDRRAPSHWRSSSSLGDAAAYEVNWQQSAHDLFGPPSDRSSLGSSRCARAPRPAPPRPRRHLRRPHPVRRGKQEASERVLWQPPLREARPPGIASRMFLVLPKEPHSPGNGIAVSASPMPTPPMISTHRQKPAASACSGLSATATPSTLSYERYGRSRSTGGRLGDHDQRSVTGRGHALPSSTSCSTMRGRGSEVRDGTW